MQSSMTLCPFMYEFMCAWIAPSTLSFFPLNSGSSSTRLRISYFRRVNAVLQTRSLFSFIGTAGLACPHFIASAIRAHSRMHSSILRTDSSDSVPVFQNSRR